MGKSTTTGIGLQRIPSGGASCESRRMVLCSPQTSWGPSQRGPMGGFARLLGRFFIREGLI